MGRQSAPGFIDEVPCPREPSPESPPASTARPPCAPAASEGPQAQINRCAGSQPGVRCSPVRDANSGIPERWHERGGTPPTGPYGRCRCMRAGRPRLPCQQAPPLPAGHIAPDLACKQTLAGSRKNHGPFIALPAGLSHHAGMRGIGAANQGNSLRGIPDSVTPSSSGRARGPARHINARTR
jgi:hypothetical protein